MAHASSKQMINTELLSLLKIDDKGWNIDLFENKTKISQDYLCAACGHVCCNAVELGCDHDDEAILLYCNICLKHQIEDNNNKCLLGSHSDPIIGPNRAIRRKISKSIVMCPYSIQYRVQKNSKYRKNNDNGHVIDTIGNDEKEGAAPQQSYNDDNKDININGCEWKGTLSDLLNDVHLSQCVKKFDASFSQNVMIKQLQIENKKLNEIIGSQKQNISEQHKLINILQTMNEQNKETINNLRSQIDETINDKITTVEKKNENLEAKYKKIASEYSSLMEEYNEYIQQQNIDLGQNNNEDIKDEQRKIINMLEIENGEWRLKDQQNKEIINSLKQENERINNQLNVKMKQTVLNDDNQDTDDYEAKYNAKIAQIKRLERADRERRRRQHKYHDNNEEDEDEDDEEDEEEQRKRDEERRKKIAEMRRLEREDRERRKRNKNK